MKIVTTLLTIAATAGLFTSASAQSTATASTTATLVTPLGITMKSDMNFGTVAASGTAGTVILTSAGVVSATGGARVNAGTNATAAVFDVVGDGERVFSITIPTELTLKSGSNGPELSVSGIAAETTTGALVAGKQ